MRPPPPSCHRGWPARARRTANGYALTPAAEQVLAAELNGRQESGDALAMMVSSMVHMVQAGKTRSTSSRWSA